MKLVQRFAFLFISISYAFGHGLVVDPPSRAAYCGLNEKPDNATTAACVEAFAAAEDSQAGYKYMSILTHTEGRAAATVLPANVCSFDSETWNGAVTPWDVPASWPTSAATPGPVEITWDIQWGPHFDDTREFHYWITKADFVFDPATPLTWDDFETEPFCAEGYDDTNPTANPNVVSDKDAVTFTTTCTLPARNGHHVVYSEWGRNQWTYERFHSCIDLAFGDSNSVPPVAVAQQLAIDQGESADITLQGNDSDGTVESYTLESQPQNGTLTGTGNQYTYIPQASFVGQDSFQFSVTDNDSLTSSPATITISVNRAGNTAPLASFVASTQALTLNLDATASSDIDNDLLLYSWDLGDGTQATGSQISHVYNASGTYDVVLTVSDGALTDSEMQAVTVSQSGEAKALCEYVVTNDWGSGFAAEIRIINSTANDIDGWQVSWQYSNDTNITSAWSANVSGSGDTVVATPLSWNAKVGAGQQVSFGIQGTYSGENQVPDVTGDICF